MSLADDILAATKSVTKLWTRQRKQEEKDVRAKSSRQHLFKKSRVSFTDVMGEILPAAYQHASGGGKHPVSKRQLYYASRQKFLELTGKPIDATYFSNKLLVQYMNRHPETESWDMTADARGTLTIPNASHDIRIPCGTLQIRGYLARIANGSIPGLNVSVPPHWPSQSGSQRFQAVLYVEKEGFEPLLSQARIAERYDLAILSCKGQSVVAARRFVDEVCRADGGVPLFVAHDLDKSGFEISQRLTSVSDWAEENDLVAYRFNNQINVTDLGLRLVDAQQYGLQHEDTEFKGDFAPDSIATDEEKEFLRSNRRIELNAFTSPQFIEWLEAKLQENGLTERLVPNDSVLEAAYRRALAVARVNAALEEAIEDAVRASQSAEVPASLREQLQARLTNDGPAWDAVLYQIARSKLK